MEINIVKVVSILKVLYRYFTIEIVRSVIFTLVVFLTLFAFFEFIIQIELISHNNYQLKQALLYLIVSLFSNIYELMPIAVLIGTIYALSKFAINSEFIIMRMSGISNLKVIKIFINISFVFSVITMLFSECILPKTNRLEKKIKLESVSLLQQKKLSEFWIKDIIKDNTLKNNTIIGTRFLNIQRICNNGYLEGIKIYQLDKNFHLTNIIIATSAHYLGNYLWQLSQVHRTNFIMSDNQISSPTTIISAKMQVLISKITPKILLILTADPHYMAIWDLFIYIQYLQNNNQSIEQYQIMFWKKIIYPVSIFVMMILALPFASLHFRTRGINIKIFTGIMIGVCFYLMNNLFSYVGLLNAWPAYIIAILPSSIFMLIALIILRLIKQS